MCKTKTKQMKCRMYEKSVIHGVTAHFVGDHSPLQFSVENIILASSASSVGSFDADPGSSLAGRALCRFLLEAYVESAELCQIEREYQTQSVLQLFKDQQNCEHLDINRNELQEHLDAFTIKPIVASLFTSNAGSKEETARLLAVAEPESSKWLQVIPSRHLGTYMDNACLRISVSLRLGTKICKPHRCRCGKLADPLGRHALSCSMSAGRHARHGAINDTLSRALTSAGIPNRREVAGLLRDDNKRPDGMTLIPFANGRPLVWDDTVVDPLAASYVDQSSRAAGAASNQAERNKYNKYLNLPEAYNFQPFAFDTYGVPGSDTRLLVKDIARRLVGSSGDIKAGEYLRQRLSVDIQRGNAASILGTFPDADCPQLRELDNLF